MAADPPALSISDADLAECEQWARTALRLGPDAAVAERDEDGRGVTVRVRLPMRPRMRVSLVIDAPPSS